MPNLIVSSLQTGYDTAILPYQVAGIHEVTAQAIRKQAQLPLDNPYRKALKQQGESLARDQLDTSSSLKTEKIIIGSYLKAKLHLAGMERYLPQLKF